MFIVSCSTSNFLVLSRGVDSGVSLKEGDSDSGHVLLLDRAYYYAVSAGVQFLPVVLPQA